MRKPVLMIVCFSALAGCESATNAVDDVARRSAKAAVAETLTTQFPSVPNKVVTPFSDCIIDNSNTSEIAKFAKAAVVGVDDATVTLVRTVLSRPETTQCVTKAGVAALAG